MSTADKTPVSVEQLLALTRDRDQPTAGQNTNRLQERLASAGAQPRVYPISELLPGTAEEFLLRAYRTLLLREPDPPGFYHFLGNLRHNRLTRLEVLHALSHSPEGRRYQVRIKYLSLRYLLCCRIPGGNRWFGWLFT